MKTSPLARLAIPTADGTFLACYSARGLAGLAFPGARSDRVTRHVPARIRQWHRQAARALRAALAGRPAGPLPPMDLTCGTPFQRAVWTELQRIPPGQTRSYRDVARRVGRPDAARAVGAACGANPIPVLVPCHRVLASHGGLGGFSSGLAWKRRLLEREGVLARPTRPSASRRSEARHRRSGVSRTSEG